MKDLGSTLIIPRKQELSMAGSTVHRVACPKGMIQEKSQQVCKGGQDKNEDSRNGSVYFSSVYQGQTGPPRCLCFMALSIKLSSLLSDGCLSLTPLSSSKTSRGKMRNCLFP